MQVIRWEDGVYSPDLEQAQRLAAALGCAVQDFIEAPRPASPLRVV